MKSKKSFLVLFVILLALMAGLTACGTGGSSGASGKSMNLSVMWEGPQPRHKATLKALDLYSKNHPNVKFTSTYTDWTDYWNKLTTLAASHRMPDIMQQDAAYIQQYVNKGTLADLSDIDLNGILDSKIVNRVKINGKLYGVPISGNGQGMIYDVDLTKKYGVSLPKNGWSWDDYFSWAKEAHAKLPKGKYGITDSSDGWDWFQFYQMSQGKGHVLDGAKFHIDKTLWFQMQNIYAQFRKDGVVPPANMTSSMKFEDPKLDPVASGKVLTETTSVGAAQAIQKMVKDKVAVLSDPTGPKGGGWAEPTMFWSVGKNSKHLAEDKNIIKWLVGNQEAGKILGTTRGIPLNQGVWNELKPNLGPGSVIQKQLLDAATPYALPFSPAPPGWNDWVTQYKAEIQAVQFGKETLDQAYNKIVKLGNSTAAKLAKQKK